ncbi:MAG: type II toxin-antitoxin system VapC family toxin [Deltaproteobacteria bacterium]|nr:type II toxin-antitoxin system VapC family toxin [Deltaproteobacteria bacterium]
MIYLDTGCLLKLYYPEPESAKVARLVAAQVIALGLLHEIEFSNAIEHKLFRKEATLDQARLANALLEKDVRGGVLHRPAIAWEEVLADARLLARTHTRTIGCRSLDVVHCAIARHLSATSFITTDRRQRRLARAIGLSCPVV